MTPYEIDLILWYYSRAEDHPDVKRDPPIFQPTMRAFLHDELLRYLAETERHQKHPMSYEITERGQAYVEALMRVPLPVQRWVMP